MSMTVSYTSVGRTDQKTRTMNALTAATRRLLAGGETPTVESAAAAASVSRATAYRYFPNRRALIAAAHPETEAASLLGDDPPTDPEQRLDAAVDAILAMTLETETELRTMLRLSLDPSPADPHELVLRKGRRIVWVEDALAPMRGRLAPRELRRLVHAIAAAVGIDALVWLTDVAGVPRKEACDVMRWSARALLRAAVADA